MQALREFSGETAVHGLSQHVCGDEASLVTVEPVAAKQLSQRLDVVWDVAASHDVASMCVHGWFVAYRINKNGAPHVPRWGSVIIS